MKTLPIFLLLGMLAFGQGQPSKIDWSACEELQRQMAPAINAFNAAHADGFSANAMCTFGRSKSSPVKPKKQIMLTNAEYIHLLHLRAESSAALKEQGDYEDEVIANHDVKQLKTTDPCWYFVGIIYNTDYITVDPNPFDPSCPPAEEPAKTKK